MKTAFSVWNNRIAPVFDVTRQVRLVEVADGRIVHEDNESLPENLPAGKAIRLTELGVGTLVCGAISRPLQEMVAAYGIRVVPFVAGDLCEVIQAWISGGLDGDTFVMPGCFGGGRHRHSGNIDQEEYLINGKKRGGMGSGGGQGQGRGGRRPGRMGGPNAAGPVSCCVCPQCGQREPHKRGLPCFERKCPQCGAAMTRE